ncbi:MAG: adenosine kinase [Bacteroidota bacterium]
MEKVLGIGNALVDIMTKLKNDDLLQKFNLPKGSMQLIDRDFAEKLTEATKNLEKFQSSGGSAANTIHGVAGLGVPAGFIGTVGKDELGDLFHEDMRNNNIDPKLFRSQTITGRSIALVSPDSERTMATLLGAAVELSPDDLTESIFKGYDYLHIEGYLILNHELLKKAFELAKKAGMKVSLDLASFNVVEDNLEFLKNFVKDYVDVLFANEEEAKAFTGKEPEEALDELSELCEIAVVKVGKEGSFVKKGSEKAGIEPIEANPIDTTGAGDAYAGGFLYGLIKGYPMDKCGYIGAVLAGKVIEGMGAKMDEAKWKEIYGMID